MGKHLYLFKTNAGVYEIGFTDDGRYFEVSGRIIVFACLRYDDNKGWFAIIGEEERKREFEFYSGYVELEYNIPDIGIGNNVDRQILYIMSSDTFETKPAYSPVDTDLNNYNKIINYFNTKLTFQIMNKITFISIISGFLGGSKKTNKSRRKSKRRKLNLRRKKRRTYKK
jgi:hypothetical protein